MKKRILSMILALTMILSITAILSACGGGSDNGGNGTTDGPTGDAVTISFWHPITGPDSKYMQTLIKSFNDQNKGKYYVNASAQAGEALYDKINKSFSDKSTADLCLINNERIAQFVKNGKLADMTSLIAASGFKKEDYVGGVWESCQVDGKMYAMPYDILPIILFYNRELIPEGYTEADILSDDFTVEKMIEMAKAAYDNSNPRMPTYGIAFNFAYTDAMFLSFLTQFGISPVSASDPYTARFDGAEGVAIAKAIMSMPLTKNADGLSISSESGKDHLDIFCQGRALFTLDGIWSAPSACKKVEGRLDAGVALLPKVNSDAERTVSGNSHVFATFNTANGGKVDEKKQEAISAFMKYLVENSAYWAEGGKVAARADVVSNNDYMNLEWGYLSTKLDRIIFPEKVHTYNAMINRIGYYVANLCEGKTTNVQSALNSAASEGESLANQLK